MGCLAIGFTFNVFPSLLADGKTIAFICSKGRGTENDVCVIPASGGAARNLTADWPLDPGSASWSLDGKTIYIDAETRGNVHLFAVPAAGGAVRQGTTGERQLRGLARRADGRFLPYPASDVTPPVGLFVAPLATPAQGRRVTSFNDAPVTGIAMIPADTFWFTGVGGMRIEGWLMKPYGYQPGKSYPLVLSIHGGPHSNYGNVLFPEFQVLAGQGYWTLFTNPRGSSGYGHAFTYATRGRWGMEDYQDLIQAVGVGVGRGGVDTTRMAVLGGAYGGVLMNWV